MEAGRTPVRHIPRTGECENAEHGLAYQALEAVSSMFMIEPDCLLEKNRDHQRVIARALLYRLLARLGYSCGAISRLSGRNHSTIVHGLRTDAIPPELQDHVDRMVSLLYRHKNDWTLTGIPAPVRPSVHVYLDCLLADQAGSIQAYAGLVYLAGHPAARTAAAMYLAASDHAAHSWRIRVHARQAGIRWHEVDPEEQANTLVPFRQRTGAADAITSNNT